MSKNAAAFPLEALFWGTHYVDALAVRFWNSNGDTDFLDAGEIQYYSHDANYNVTGVYDPAGVVTERYQYTPYGELKVLDANFANDADGLSDFANGTTFTGRLLDTEYGQYYFRNRNYGAGLGRFCERDPIGYADGLNLYEAFASRPLSALDPAGTDVWIEEGRSQYEWQVLNDVLHQKVCVHNWKSCNPDVPDVPPEICFSFGIAGISISGGLYGQVYIDKKPGYYNVYLRRTTCEEDVALVTKLLTRVAFQTRYEYALLNQNCRTFCNAVAQTDRYPSVTTDRKTLEANKCRLCRDALRSLSTLTNNVAVGTGNPYPGPPTVIQWEHAQSNVQALRGAQNQINDNCTDAMKREFERTGDVSCPGGRSRASR